MAAEVTTTEVNGASRAEKRPAEDEQQPAGEQNGTPAAKKAKHQDATDLERKIIEQVEYYFGDINLPRDRFLMEEIKKDNGWIPLETLLKFNRLKTLSDDAAVISAAMRKSTTGLMEVHEDGLKVRRCEAMPENSLEFWKGIKRRSVYVKGFPPDASLDKIRECLCVFGQLDQVLMRRVQGPERIFKGSVFATYRTMEECQKLVKEEKVLFGDAELLREMQEDYMERKQKATQEARRQQKEEKRNRRLNNLKFKAGCLVRVTGVPKEGEQWKDLKNLFAEHASVSRVEHNTGADAAFIRLDAASGASGGAADTKEATPAEKLHEKLKGSIEYKECTLKVEVVGGDEEKDFYINQDKLRQEREEQKRKHQKQKQDEKRKNQRNRRDRGKKGGEGAVEKQQSQEGESKKTLFADSSSDEEDDKKEDEGSSKTEEKAATAGEPAEAPQQPEEKPSESAD